MNSISPSYILPGKHRAVTLKLRARQVCVLPGEIVISLPENQRLPRTLHIQKDVLPYALC